MKHEVTMEDIQGVADFLGIKTKQKGREVLFQYCPYCRGSAPKDDEYKFGVNIDSGACGCFRSSCGWKGHVYMIGRDFGYKFSFDNDTEYKQLPQPTAERKIIPHESALAYLKGRGISKATAEKYQITAYENEPWKMFIPFFNEYGKLECIKYRKMNFKKGRDKNKEWFEAGCKPILFGMFQCEDFGTLVITEGQMDSLSLAEIGVKNACSVPNGANGFSWIANCWDWVTKFERIIVFGDLEKGHMSLLDEITQRLPNKIYAVRKEDYMGEKDANAILTAFGPEALWHCIQNAREPEIDYVIDLADVHRKNDENELKIRTGITDLDEVLKGGLREGQVMLLSGKSGEGKSTLASMMVAEALDQGLHVFMYSGELDNDELQECLDYQLACDEMMTEKRNEFNKPKYILDESVEARIREWYRGRAFIYDNNRINVKDKPRLPDLVRKVIVRRDAKLILIDNLMTAMDYVKNQNDLYLAQGHFVDEMKEIAQQYHVAIILIAHQRKSPAGSKGEFGNDDIAGSSDIVNRVDIVANYKKAKSEAEYDSCLEITKNRKCGWTRQGDDAIHLNYSARSKRVTGARSIYHRFGWEKQPIQVEDIDVPF